MSQQSVANIVGDIYPGAKKHDASELQLDTDAHPDVAKAKKSPRESYDPAKSLTSHDALNAWLKEPIDGKVNQIPGIGDANVKHLRDCDENITTSYQLIGKFLCMRGLGTNQVEHCDRFYAWLKDVGRIHYGRNSIVQAVASKANIFFPGLYDEAAFAELHS